MVFLAQTTYWVSIATNYRGTGPHSELCGTGIFGDSQLSAWLQWVFRLHEWVKRG